MFENYDERCSERIRSSFRLPPLFIGKVRDFNFATAIAAYQIAESQVFQPERMEFDNIMTRFINTELGFDDIRFRSLPIILSDSKVQLDALKYAFDKSAIDTEQMIDAMNSVTSLGLTFDEALEKERKSREEKERQDALDAANNNPDDDQDDDDQDDDNPQKVDTSKPEDGTPYGKDKPKPKKKYNIHKDAKDITALIDMANEIVKLLGAKGDEVEPQDKSILEKYNKMESVDQVFVKDLISMKVLDHTEIDRTGANELLEGCLHTLDESEPTYGRD